jgi:hypothetical protein
MKKFVFGALIAGAIAAVSFVSPASAQATRTWVSGVGDDANPCSRTAPCKTFAGAISKTAAAGEINCIDPGGFGALTITKSIAIICDNVEAGVLVSGTNGIVVSAAATDIIYLSGLDFEGLGPTALSLSGVLVNSAAQVHVVNSTIRGFKSGSTGNGVRVAPTAGNVFVHISNTRIASNNIGVEVNPTGSANALVVADRTFSDNNSSHGFRANNGGSGTALIHLNNSEASGNGGAGVTGAAGANSVVRVGQSTFQSNTGGDIPSSPGQIISYGTNQVSDASVPPTTPQR